MKIYISGKISGLDYSAVQDKFGNAESFLQSLGFDVENPLKNGLSNQDSWESHMARDIAMLFPCDAIYMMDGWTTSTGACIEYDIAVRMKKDIWFESNIVKTNACVLEIQNAIHEVTGMRFQEYTTKSRKRNGFFARMLFVYHCRRNRMKLVEIARYVNRDHTSMLHLLNKYDDEVKYNPAFGDMARKVDEILKKTKS